MVAAAANADPACTLRIKVDRREPAWIRLRSVRPEAPGGCALDTDTLRRTLAAALAAAGPVVTVALGRLVGYPALACGLAAQAAADPGWDRRHGRARDGRSDNTWTAQALAASQPLAGLLPAGWTLQAVSVEKVLKGRPAQQLADCPVEGGGLPFDAQLWLRLRRR